MGKPCHHDPMGENQGPCLQCRSLKMNINETPNPAINPKHYKDHPSGIECITIVEHMNFNLGNAIKYIWRAGQKDNVIQDLEKARWYLDREIQRQKA